MRPLGLKGQGILQLRAWELSVGLFEGLGFRVWGVGGLRLHKLKVELGAVAMDVPTYSEEVCVT